MLAAPASRALSSRLVNIWRGDDDHSVVWDFSGQLAAGFLNDSTVVLIVQWGVLPMPTGEFTRSTHDGAILLDEGLLTVAWSPSASDLAGVPIGSPVRYEVKRIHEGRTLTLAWGEIKLGSGLLRKPGETPGGVGQSYTDLRVAALRSELLAALAAIQPAPDGGPGPGALVFSQASPSASWSIPHAFGRLPSVAVYDATGAELLAEIAATPTAVSIVFAAPTVGTAVLT